MRSGQVYAVAHHNRITLSTVAHAEWMTKDRSRRFITRADKYLDGDGWTDEWGKGEGARSGRKECVQVIIDKSDSSTCTTEEEGGGGNRGRKKVRLAQIWVPIWFIIRSWFFLCRQLLCNEFLLLLLLESVCQSEIYFTFVWFSFCPKTSPILQLQPKSNFLLSLFCLGASSWLVFR